MGDGNTIDPRRCATAVGIAASSTIMHYALVRELGGAISTDDPSVRERELLWVVGQGTILLVNEKLWRLQGYTQIPHRAWQRVWRDCGRPGRGLFEELKKFVTAFNPKPRDLPVPVPAGEPFRMTPWDYIPDMIHQALARPAWSTPYLSRLEAGDTSPALPWLKGGAGFFPLVDVPVIPPSPLLVPHAGPLLAPAL